MSDPFTTLGLPKRYAIDLEQIEARYRELQKALHPDRHSSAPASARRMNLLKAVEVNEAYRTLKDELSRAEALLKAVGADKALSDKPEDPEFLMEVMELREELGDAKASGDLARVRALAQRVGALRDETRARLVQGFDRLPAAPQESELEGVAALIGRLKYYRRFMDEVDVIEEQALT